MTAPRAVDYDLTIKEASDRLDRGEISAVELTEAVLSRINAVEPQVKAYLHVDEDSAREQAAAADKSRRDGGVGPLLGIPLAVKDNICIQGMPATCASKILSGFVSPYDATVTGALKKSGAVLLGKTNLDEFAMGSSTENSAMQVTSNPWDLSRVPGGSSGGSAAAVAAGQALAALGSDTGGSIRQPAAFCGVVGLKPTYGVVSRYGLVAFASSLDQIGPLTKDVADAALLLNVLAGHDRHDSTSIDREYPDFTAALDGGVDGLRLGFPQELVAEGVSDDIKAVVDGTIKKLEAQGAIVEPVSLPTLAYALSAYYIIAPAEASSNLARFDGVRYGRRAEGAKDLLEMYKRTRAEGFGPEVKRRIMLGTYALSAGYYDAYYGQAQKVRTLIIDEFKQAFDKFDALISPTTPTTAFEIGAKTASPVEMYLSDVLTIPANLAGLPAISVPVGLVEGLPVGLQVMAKHFDETTVLRVGAAVERQAAFGERPLLD